ncbi:hypothetical protein H9634_01395 [Brevibacterium sp. Re57]|uniref:Uncharacterized protein n=1 Tax=Brevibacterium gallinarum TaxID=2762220 RepID=A0ABR8WRB8_9MICO|nr:hypothetical protein [Brevibacterium gallinarum]
MTAITRTVSLGLIATSFSQAAFAVPQDQGVTEADIIALDGVLRRSTMEEVTPFSQGADMDSDDEVSAPDLNSLSMTLGEGNVDGAVTISPVADIQHVRRMDEISSFAGVDERGYGHVLSPKQEDEVQFGVVLPRGVKAAAVSYRVSHPDGVEITTDGSVALVRNQSGEFLGGFEPAWAVDSEGLPVPSWYTVEGDVLTQRIDLSGAGVNYPVVADPLFKRGIIRRVNHERWKKGSWEVQVEVTKAARLMRVHDWRKTANLGYADLVDHYPRSMKKATMRQQWDCHILGLYGTFKIDLEGYRRSKPNWARTEIARGVKSAFKKKDARAVARACNW